MEVVELVLPFRGIPCLQGLKAVVVVGLHLEEPFQLLEHQVVVGVQMKVQELAEVVQKQLQEQQEHLLGKD